LGSKTKYLKSNEIIYFLSQIWLPKLFIQWQHNFVPLKLVVDSHNKLDDHVCKIVKQTSQVLSWGKGC
jgi:hypothetical protein